MKGSVHGHCAGERMSLAGEIGENALGDVLGQIGRTDLGQGGSICHIRMAVDELAEGGIIVVFHGVTQQLDVGWFLHLTH